jgi:ribosomal protein S5
MKYLVQLQIEIVQKMTNAGKIAKFELSLTGNRMKDMDIR